jgi:hypothetical protein
MLWAANSLYVVVSTGVSLFRSFLFLSLRDDIEIKNGVFWDVMIHN